MGPCTSVICKLGADRGADRPALDPEVVRCLDDVAVKSRPAEHLAERFSGAAVLLQVRSRKSVGAEIEISLDGTEGTMGMSLGFPKICPVFAYIP